MIVILRGKKKWQNNIKSIISSFCTKTGMHTSVMGLFPPVTRAKGSIIKTTKKSWRYLLAGLKNAEKEEHVFFYLQQAKQNNPCSSASRLYRSAGNFGDGWIIARQKKKIYSRAENYGCGGGLVIGKQTNLGLFKKWRRRPVPFRWSWMRRV